MSGNAAAGPLAWMLAGMLVLLLVEGWAHAQLTRRRQREIDADLDLDARIARRYRDRLSR